MVIQLPPPLNQAFAVAAMASEPLVSARKRKKKDRKVGASESPTLKGVLYRGSHVVPDCVKLREAILFE